MKILTIKIKLVKYIIVYLCKHIKYRCGGYEYFLYCKEKLIHLRKLLNFEVENPADFLRLEPLVFEIRIEDVATLTKKINTVNYIFEKIYFTSCVDFFRLRREIKSPRANDGARRYIQQLSLYIVYGAGA